MPYRLIGTTDDCTQCDFCGKAELRMTVVIESLDADGNADSDPIYAGTTCAARKLNMGRGGARKVSDAGNAVKRLMGEAKRFADEMRGIAFNTYLKANLVAFQNYQERTGESGAQFAKDSWHELNAEVALIDSGTLVGTRFEKQLPTL